MIVMLCGEGSTDCGDPNQWDSRTKTHVSTDGWMQPIIRQFEKYEQAEFEVKYRSSLTLLSPTKRIPAQVVGHGQKAFMAKSAAIREECDIVVFMVDADDTTAQRHKEIFEQIINGFNAFPNDAVGCVACIPASASEAWLLADQAAWDSLCGKRVENLPQTPESIWGAKSDPKSDRPHNYFARICIQEGHEDNRDTRAQLGKLINIKTLHALCPVSFVSFHNMINDPLYS